MYFKLHGFCWLCYRYVRENEDGISIRQKRAKNSEFYFMLINKKMRVWEKFFWNTLDINDSTIQTTIEKSCKVTQNILQDDRRGKHGKQKNTDSCILKNIRNYINSIPQFERHYVRARTTRTFYAQYLRIHGP